MERNREYFYGMLDGFNSYEEYKTITEVENDITDKNSNKWMAMRYHGEKIGREIIESMYHKCLSLEEYDEIKNKCSSSYQFWDYVWEVYSIK